MLYEVITVTIRDIEKEIDGHVPIVALTASAFNRERELCFQSGMDDYITKPVVSDVIHVITSYSIHYTKLYDFALSDHPGLCRASEDSGIMGFF